jgi:hydrogenase maturation protein HypF
VGGQMKNTVAISQGHQLVLSQHLGELQSLDSQNLFAQTLTDLQGFYTLKPERIIHDLHPDYHSTIIANQQSIDKKSVQHHHAHVLSCMAEHDLQTPILGFAWDGTGLGIDNTIWGGECLLLDKQKVQRYAYFKHFPLVGGDKAATEPRRSALGLLYGIYADSLFDNKIDYLANFSAQELKLLQQSLNRRLNTINTSSVGRLFDAISSLLGLCHINNYEGQAAILLEQLASTSSIEDSYSFTIIDQQALVIDWQSMIIEILSDLPKIDKNIIAAKFHNTLAEMMLNVTMHAKQQKIVLTGGCFQNAYLTEKCVSKLEAAGFKVYTHEKIPPNDGGIALGQLYSSLCS